MHHHRTVRPVWFAASALLFALGCRPSTDATQAPAGAGQEAPAPAQAFAAPATRPGEEGALEYVDPPRYDASNVADLAPGAASPEAAVVHYLASRVRGDQRYREVMTAYCKGDCAESLAEHDGWKFRAFRLVSRAPDDAGGLWIEAWFEVEIEGQVDSGSDEFTVTKGPDGWRIVEVPT